jgi:hypothetical protein
MLSGFALWLFPLFALYHKKFVVTTGCFALAISHTWEGQSQIEKMI